MTGRDIHYIKRENGVWYGKIVLHKLFRFQFPAAEQQGEEAQARVPLALLHICACGIAPQLAGSLFFQGGNGYK